MIERFEHFTLSIFNINRYWNKIATEEMKKYGLRGAYALYLVILAGYGGKITASKLAELCQRDKADVSRALSAFQQKGLLEPYEGAKYRATPVLSATRAGSGTDQRSKHCESGIRDGSAK